MEKSKCKKKVQLLHFRRTLMKLEGNVEVISDICLSSLVSSEGALESRFSIVFPLLI